MVVNPYMFDSFVSSLTVSSVTSRRLVGPQTKGCFPPLSVLDGRRLTVDVCGRARYGPACFVVLFFFICVCVFWIQISIARFALF